MSIEAIAALDAASLVSGLGNAAGMQGGSAFSTVLDQVSALNAQMKANDRSVAAMALGDGVHLHEVMMDLERTRITFDLMLQVRNKVMDAYQELMRMQV